MANELFTPGQFEIVTALLGEDDSLGEGVIDALAAIASRGLVTAQGDEVLAVTTRSPATQAR